MPPFGQTHDRTNDAPANSTTSDNHAISQQQWDSMAEHSKLSGQNKPTSQDNQTQLSFDHDIYASKDAGKNPKVIFTKDQKEKAFLWGPNGESPTNSINPDAVHQGELGDCYFMSSLASLAKSNPQSIQNMIKDNGNNTYTVTFPGDPDHPVNIDKPSQEEISKYGHGDSEHGNWVSVIEKAHRKYTGRDTSDEGDDPINAIKLLTKQGSGTVDDKLTGYVFGVGRTSEDNVAKDLKNATQDNRVIVASSGRDDKPATFLGANNEPENVVANHAYSVVGFDEKTNTVKLRNPWGSDGARNSTFDMSLDEFYNTFNDLQFTTN
ncbi:MAG TPA: C2 family cysteine protease [Drouetiella sp.]